MSKLKTCPSCGSNNGLWREGYIPAWQEIDVESNGTIVAGQHETHSNDFEPDGHGLVGCNCGWEGALSQLVTYGWDGHPLPAVNPMQERLA